MGNIFKMGWSGGVNLLVDPHALRDDQLANAKNAWPTVEGILAKRESVSALETIKGPNGLALTAVQFWTPDKVTGFDMLAQFKLGNTEMGTNILAAVQLGKQIPIPPAAPALPQYIDTGPEFPSGLISGTPMASLVNYNGRAVAVSGGEGFYQFTQAPATGDWGWLKSSFNWAADASNGVPNAQTQVVGVSPRVVATYRGRLIWLNFGPGMGHWMVMGDRPQTNQTHTNTYDVPSWGIIGSDVLAANGRHFEVGAIAGEDIIWAGEISNNSVNQPLTTAFLILTARSAVICTGELAESNDPGTTYSNYLGDLVAAKVNFDCGIAGPRAITRAPNGVFWANGEDVYALYDGAPKPIVVGTNIRPALANTPDRLRYVWHMAYAKGCVYLSLATQNSVSVVQPAVQHWRLDLRPVGDGNEAVVAPQGPGDARWWGPQDYENFSDTGGQGGSVTGLLSTALWARRGEQGQDSILGGFYGDATNSGLAPLLHLVSFNDAFGGRDAPYKELVSALTWQAYDVTNNPLYAVGDAVMPSPLKRNGRIYICTTGGQPGGTEPTWPTTSGGTVVDNAVTWTELVQSTVNLRTPSYYGADYNGNAGNLGVRMEVDFKEYDFGEHMRDKVFKRADVSAYAGLKQQLWLDCLLNGGNYRGYMGPCVIGGNSLVGAINDLGPFVLDTSDVAQEFQARQMRPNENVNRTKQDSVAPGVVRGRTIQPRLRDGAGFVIDDTNDYVCWCSINTADPVTGVDTLHQVQLAHGYYSGNDNVLSLIRNAINTANVTAPAGFTGLQWNFDAAYTAAYPYFNTWTIAFTTRTAGYILSFLCLSEVNGPFTYQGSAFYADRCHRLLAQLGFDVGNAYSDAFQTAYGFRPTVTGPLGGPVHANMVAEQVSPVLTSPTRICATQSIPYYVTPDIQVTEVEGEVIRKAGRPYGLSGRLS